jgi:4-amino-4-deoxy-L-arabinose transferase-like glycosyltransferase
MSAVIDRVGRPVVRSLLSFVVRRIGHNPGLEKLVLSLYCAVLLFFGINSGPFYRTEGLRAIVAAEFLHSGNWLVPTLYGEPLLTKPPGHYAAIALASLPVGRVMEWSARLPSALAACAIVLIFYAWFRHDLGRRAGFIAAIIVPSSIAWFDRVPSAEIDMVHLAWVVGSLYCGYRAVARNYALAQPSRGGWWWIAALLCVAAGVLTKWTTPLFFYGTLVPFLWWRGRLQVLLAARHLWAVALAGLIVGAWLGAVLWSVGSDRLLETVWQEAIPKFFPGTRPGGYPWEQLFSLPVRQLVANLPWAAFAVLTLVPRISKTWTLAEKHLLLFFHCWLWPSLVFWSLVPNHAPRHSFPLAPAIAALAALVWIKWMRTQLHWPCQRFFPAAYALGVILIGILIAKLSFMSLIVPERTRLRQPQKTGQILAQLVPPGATLYLCGVKDEGVMFYYGRPVRRFHDPTLLPSQDELLYCIITEAEWWHWHNVTTGQTLHELHDELGAKLLLVHMRFDPSRAALHAYKPPAERTAAW